MRIRMTVSIAGRDFDLQPGDETERFQRDEAMRLISAGFAVPCVEQQIETATLMPAIERRGRRKRNVASLNDH